MTANEIIPTGKIDLKKLQDQIKERQRQWTQEELGKVIGTDRVTFNYKLQGKRPFRFSELVLLAGRLGLNYQVFLKNDNQADVAAS